MPTWENLLFWDQWNNPLVQTGTVAEDQECAADASWSHKQHPGVEESAVGTHHISYVDLRKDVVTFGEVLRSFLPQICIRLETMLLKLHAKLVPGCSFK